MRGEARGRQEELKEFRRKLLRWYDENRRELPWRKTKDPYRIWVSEIMLQQTRVAAVLEHYRRFLEKFPDVNSLAEARESDVLAAWSGLGYYRRARAMHATAKLVVAELGGKLPRSAAELQKLHGIGRYTSAAIASIAFGEPVAVVDGNVERVLTRVTGTDMRGREDAWLHAQEMLDPKRAGDWNQAMMELGATLCAPTEPQCLVCPVRNLCKEPGRQAKKARGERKRKEVYYGLARKNRSVYLVQRGSDAKLMAGMYELPSLPESVGGAVICRVRHSITNSDYEVTAVEMSPRALRGGAWFALESLPEMALTGVTRKILKAAQLWKESC